MKEMIQTVTQEFLKQTQNKPIRIISHFDTDGITSAAILIKAFQRLDKPFTVNIIKSLNKEIITQELKRQPKEVLIFSDLASNSLEHMQNTTEPIFILDHHDINTSNIPENIKIISPHLSTNPTDNNCTGAGICYLFAKEISDENKDLAKIAIIGLIGDRHETNISKINQEIIDDTKHLEIKKGITLYPATRALKRTLEYSTSPIIPGVTANPTGVIELLKEAEISFDKTLLDLNQEEMGRLLTSIMIRKEANTSTDDILGNLFILKFFSNNEDVREISTVINACSRLGDHDIAISYCLESQPAKTKALDIYTKYKHELVSSLKLTETLPKEQGDNFLIINAQDQIKPEIIGTICSMLTSSNNHPEGTILITMAQTENNTIKISARTVGQQGRNLKELLEKTITEIRNKHPDISTEYGGHPFAAGALIPREIETTFIEILKQNIQMEIVKI